MSTPSKETLRRYWKIGIRATPGDRERTRALARREGLPVGTYIGQVLRNVANRPIKLEWHPPPENEGQ
jgi:hypothetical protein